MRIAGRQFGRGGNDVLNGGAGTDEGVQGVGARASIACP